MLPFGSGLQEQIASTLPRKCPMEPIRQPRRFSEYCCTFDEINSSNAITFPQMLSLPQGLRFKTQKHCIEPKFHAFATTREDGKRCYGFTLVFYEEVRNRNICSAMNTLQSMFITELSSRQNGMRRVKESPASRSLPRHFKLATTSTSALSYYDIAKDKLYVAKSITLICQHAYAIAAEIFLKNIYK